MKRLSTFALFLLLCSVATAQRCAIGAFGRACAGELAARIDASGPALHFGVRNATAGATAVLVLGEPMRPSPLPGGACPLYVTPRATNMVGTIDRSGNLRFSIRLPARLPASIAMQVVTFRTDRTGRSVGSTNGVGLRCR